MEGTKTVIDADGAVLGRLATLLAKRLLLGEQIVVVNAEKAVVSGKFDTTLAFYKHRRERGDPHKGPFFPRYPDMLLKRTVRGMLPAKTARGRAALANLKVYIGCPEEFSGKAVKVETKKVTDLRCKYSTLANVCRQLGAKV
ncbi:MAG: 50S ribosomal protein L13 [Candidatus Aenigmatarchaeota archaeon]|nr:50S ribosomal protein L13 [Candidatus Aenigmarchaeota archaeon]